MRRKAVTTTYRQASTLPWRPRWHVARAERALGKPLPLRAVVHHADGSKSDDAPLVICQDQAYHMLLHARTRVKAAGGNPNTDRICSMCRLVKSVAAFSGEFRICRHCANAAWRSKHPTAIAREKRMPQ